MFDCKGVPINLESTEAIEAQAVIKKGKFPEYFLKPKFADDPEPVVQHFEPVNLPVVIRSKEMQKIMSSINNDYLEKKEEAAPLDSQLARHGEGDGAQEAEKTKSATSVASQA